MNKILTTPGKPLAILFQTGGKGVLVGPAGSYRIDLTGPAGTDASCEFERLDNSPKGPKHLTFTFTGNGHTGLDFADQAIMADGYGNPVAVAACDLNGDGVVDEADLVKFLARFGGLP